MLRNVYLIYTLVCFIISFQPQGQAEVRATYSALKEGKKIPTLTPQASQSISQFYAGLKTKTGKGLSALQVSILFLLIHFLILSGCAL